MFTNKIKLIYLLVFFSIIQVNSLVFAQLGNRLWFDTLESLKDHNGNILVGNNPASSPHIAGCVVQLIAANDDGIANPPSQDGSLTGDDTLIAQYSIGDGMPVGSNVTGMFLAILEDDNVPSGLVYARVFNMPVLSEATHYGETSVVDVGNLPAGEGGWDIYFHVNQYGLLNTNLILNINNIKQPPLANAGGPYVTNEGTSVLLDASASSDPDTPLPNLTFLWDLDCDGLYDDATGMNVSYTWNDNVSKKIGLKVTDGDNNSSYSYATVLISNVAPVLGSISTNSPIDGGSQLVLSATYADAGALDTHKVNINWGDGHVQSNVNVSGGNINLDHYYMRYGNFNITINLLDDDGGSDVQELSIVVNSVPPTADAGEIYFGDEGQIVSFDASGTIDPDTPLKELSFMWDLDNDGEYDDDNGVNPAHLFVNNYDGPIGLKVVDDAGNVSYASAYLIVLNAPPVLGVIENIMVNEKEPSIMNTTYSDAGELDSHVVSVDWGDGNVLLEEPVFAGVINLSHSYLAHGDYFVTITIKDDLGWEDTKNITISVKPVPPLADAGGPYVGIEGQVVNLTAINTIDPNDDIEDLTFHWDLDCDGLYDDAEGINPDYIWPDNTSLIIGLKVTDSGGNVSYASSAVTVNNDMPMINAIANAHINEGDDFNLNTSYADSGVSDQHTLSISWGDGVVHSNLPVSGGVIYFSHQYLYAGSYNVSMVIADNDGGSSSKSVTLVVNKVNNNPVIHFSNPSSVVISWENIEGREYKIYFCDDRNSNSSGIKWHLMDIVVSGEYIDSGDANGYDNINGTSDDRPEPSKVIQRIYKIE